MARFTTISGEYDFVTWTSRDQSALARVHNTPCTPHEARHLIAILTPNLGVRVIFNGKAGKSTRYTDGRRRISLPAKPGQGVTFLRVGLVLHEVAHQLVALRAGHGPEFINKLDDLTEWWVKRQDALEAALFESDIAVPLER